MTITRVLVANRGEIAVRIVQACQALGLETVLAVSAADRDSMPARLADRAVCIGPARPKESYLNQAAIIAAALGTGADAVHPGYGFLAENADFADACAKHGVVFVGPSANVIRSMGNKLAARETAEALGVPVVPGSPSVTSLADARRVVARIGYPVLFKAAAGGGGRGIRIVRTDAELADAFHGAAAEAEAAFGDGTVYLERYVAAARHIEVQVLADGHGRVVDLGERDCSPQRRYQKIVEEAPAVGIAAEQVAALRAAAVRLAEGIGYENAGTVEFVYDEDRREYFFLEMNTRIQVEHPVTEEVTGVDLVRAQLAVAAGDSVDLSEADVVPRGHAIECRITAESAEHGFRPSPGRISRWRPPGGLGIRLDSHCHEGYVVPPFYDSMLGKLIVHGADRPRALQRLQDALGRFEVEGVDTTIGFLAFLVEHPRFREGGVTTQWVEGISDSFRPGRAEGRGSERRGDADLSLA